MNSDSPVGALGLGPRAEVVFHWRVRGGGFGNGGKGFGGGAAGGNGVPETGRVPAAVGMGVGPRSTLVTDVGLPVL